MTVQPSFNGDMRTLTQMRLAIFLLCYQHRYLASGLFGILSEMKAIYCQNISSRYCSGISSVNSMCLILAVHWVYLWNVSTTMQQTRRSCKVKDLLLWSSAKYWLWYCPKGEVRLMSPHIGPDCSLNVNALVLSLGIPFDNVIKCKTKVHSIAFRQHHRECCGFANWLRYHERHLTARGLSRVARGTTYSTSIQKVIVQEILLTKYIASIHIEMKMGFCLYAEAALSI